MVKLSVFDERKDYMPTLNEKSAMNVTAVAPVTQTIRLDPATRLEGHLKVETQVSDGKVTSAKSSGLMFRGFENILVGKDPRDAAHITQRICGVCPISHAMASCLAMETAAGLTIPNNARLVRNLILGSNFIQSHILHFYLLALLSYVKGPDMPPWTPAYTTDLRFNTADNQRMVDHYVQALTIRRQAHEMAAIFAGKMPHASTFEVGGVTVVVKSEMITRFRTYLNTIISFIDGTYIPDVNLLAQVYPDYFNIGRGYGNLLSFGVFDLNGAGTSKLLARGRIENGAATVNSVAAPSIIEQTGYSWYNDTSGGLNPASGVTQPNPDKSGAYSWLKAPRYGGVPYEVGPLARMWVTGDYRRGISVMDRHQARATEASKIAHAIRDWLAQLDPSAAFFTPFTRPKTGTGIGLTEAPRGALGHWLRINAGVIGSYQVVTPTCWNCSPRDNIGNPGALEKALEGTPVTNGTEPVEVMRVVQSYDPCLSCAVH
jgi:hydrogenase large subunit